MTHPCSAVGSIRSCVLVVLLAAPIMGVPAQSAPLDTSHVDKTFFTKRDAVISGVALAASGVVSIFDKRIANWTQQPNIQGSSSRHDLIDNLTIVNEQPLTIAAFATYGIGRLTHSPTVADVGLHTTESLVLTVAISELIRSPLGRERPRESPDDQYSFHFGKGFTDFASRSYPSIHAAVAWAAATSLVSEMHERNSSAVTWAAPVLYTAALIPGFTRMYLNQHWASDVVAGSVLGALLGHKVVHYAHTHKRSRLDRVLLGTAVAPDGRGDMLLIKTIPIGPGTESGR
jgi:membrane-associated phospholipid phosphatase